MKVKTFSDNPERPTFLFKVSRKEAAELAQNLINGLLLKDTQPDGNFAVQGTICSEVGDKPFIFLRIEVEK